MSLLPINRSTVLLEQILKSFESILHHPTLNFEFAPASESDVTQSTDQPWFSDGAPRFEVDTNQLINRTFGTDT